jgi:hypothetical protein
MAKIIEICENCIHWSRFVHTDKGRCEVDGIVGGPDESCDRWSSRDEEGEDEDNQ